MRIPVLRYIPFLFYGTDGRVRATPACGPFFFVYFQRSRRTLEFSITLNIKLTSNTVLTKVVIKTAILADMVKAVKVMQEKANMRFTPEGLKVVVVALDKTAMVGISIPKEQFETYELTDITNFGLDMAKFGQKLGQCGEKVTLELGKNVELRSGEVKYGVHGTLVEGEKEMPTHLVPASKFTMPHAELKSIANSIKIVGDKMKLVTDGKTVVFSGRDNDFHDENVEIQKVVTGLEGAQEGHYTLGYFLPMLNAVDVDNVLIEFSSSLPMRITLGNVVYILGAWVTGK